MQTVNFSLVNGYKVKSLSIDDFMIIRNLCEKCSDYFLMTNGALPSEQDIKEIFVVLPPNKSCGDKFVLGVFSRDNKLIGIVDIVRDFPTVGEWMLGLMLIAPSERGNGIGKNLHKALKEWAINIGAKSFRIGVLQENNKGIKFWSALGYEKINECEMKLKGKTNIVNVMISVL